MPLDITIPHTIEKSYMLPKIKLALRVTTNAFDAEIESLIDAAMSDLDIAGVSVTNKNEDANDPMILRAVTLYCKLYFGEPDKVESWDRLKASYDELKARLSMARYYRRESFLRPRKGRGQVEG